MFVSTTWAGRVGMLPFPSEVSARLKVDAADRDFTKRQLSTVTPEMGAFRRDHFKAGTRVGFDSGYSIGVLWNDDYSNEVHWLKSSNPPREAVKRDLDFLFLHTKTFGERRWNTKPWKQTAKVLNRKGRQPGRLYQRVDVTASNGPIVVVDRGATSGIRVGDSVVFRRAGLADAVGVVIRVKEFECTVELENDFDEVGVGLGIPGEVLVPRNGLLDEVTIKVIEEAGVDRVFIRSPLTCEAERGVCVTCYGRDLARGKLANIGEAIGVIAAQSIGEPGTQLTMRTFHIGGAATSRAAQSTQESKHEGRIKHINVRTIINREGKRVVMNRNGELIIIDETGREKEKYALNYGAIVHHDDGDMVKSGALLAEWEPFAVPVLAEIAGKVNFTDMIEGATLQDVVDEFTHISRKVIIESRDSSLKPRIVLKAGKEESVYHMPVSANLSVENGQDVLPGDVLARIPRESVKTKDITGGLPRVAELFEARKPKDVAVITEIDGFVSFGKDYKGKRRVVVTPEGDGEPREYLIPKGKHIAVREGDYVRAGDALMDGAVNPHDILKVKGEKELARYLVDEVQEVYRLQGVKINDKHIEVVIRQMLRRVKVRRPGDTDFLVDETVEKKIFEQVNQKVREAGEEQAQSEPLLLGITKASLSTDSFLSAASFQETTRVLTQAAIEGKLDFLKGLKENVLMGRLIPAGTGYTRYQQLGLEDLEGDAEAAPAAEAVG